MTYTMTRPFILSGNADAVPTADAINKRLTKFLRAIRKAKNPPYKIEDFEDPNDFFYTPERPIAMSAYDLAKIWRRSKTISAKMGLSTGLSHLKHEEKSRLNAFAGGALVATVRDEAEADEIAAKLHGDFPWLAAATEEVWHALRLSAREGTPIRIPPLLLNGATGIGKSTWSRTLGRAIGVPHDAIEATHESSGFSISGMQRGWSTACCGRPVELILSTRYANPIIVIDEIEKAAPHHSTKGIPHSITQSMLPLLEQQSAARWSCPNLGVPFDMSMISWVMTSNTTANIPAPLRSRLRLVQCAQLTRNDIETFIRQQARSRALSDISADVACEVMQRLKVPSLRDAMRALDRARTLETRPILH